MAKQNTRMKLSKRTVAKCDDDDQNKAQAPALGPDGEPLFIMPDPEAEAAAANPVKRKGMPADSISHTCECGVVSTVYVEDAESYNEKAKMDLFKARGSRYKPSMCRWCVNRLSRAKQLA